MIGLVDYDLQTTTTANLRPPNLEIMKLATYYRIEENQFCRLVDLNESDLTSYDNIYFFSESDEPIIIPPTFLKAKNVTFGGTAFTKEYIPFENNLIDFTLPRTNIYKDFLKEKYNSGIKAKVIEHILDDTYYRHMAGTNILPLPAIRPRHKVVLYDKHFFYPDWKKLIDNISEKRPSSITCIHPIICKTVSEYFQLREKEIISRGTVILLDIDIPMKEIDYMLKKYGQYFLGDIVKASNVMLALGGDYPTSIQYYHDLIYKLNLLYSFWARSIPIKIKYIYPSIGYKNTIQNLSQCIAKWTVNDNNQDKTINEKINRKSKKEKPIPCQERDNILKMFPYAKDLFDQNYNDLSQRRLWRL